MTRSEACRAIAEKLEPKPDSAPWTFPHKSPKGFWTTPIPAISGLPNRDHLLYWVPFDPFTSEDASARLLEAMAAQNSYVWIEWDINEWCVMWKPTTLENEDCSAEYNHRDRKTAIVLAAMRWLGIEGELEGI